MKPIGDILRNPWKEYQLFTHRIWFAIALIVIFSCFLVARFFHLQITEHKLFTTLSDKNQFSLLPVAPKRGLILDRNGIVLAKNTPVFSLDLIPDHVKKLDTTLDGLRTLVQLDDEDVEQFKKSYHQSRRYEPVTLKYKLSEQEVAKFYANRYRFPGTTINARLMRVYTQDDLMTPVLGYVGRITEKELKSIDHGKYSGTNTIGKSGIEKQYEEALLGKVGYQQIETDAGGHKLHTIHYEPPIPGKDLHLTIDSRLQQVAKDALGKDRGAVVVIDPSNGEVLTLISNPSFDGNLFARGITKADYKKLRKDPSQPLYNRAIRGLYPPGSTVKPFIALQGLETETVKKDDWIYDPGYLEYGREHHVYHDWKKLGHGSVNVVKAIVVSCDIFFFRLALKLGMHNISAIMSQFGMGKKTNIDLPNEKPGVLPNPEWKKKVVHRSWYTGDTINASIGQGYMLTTPLQLAMATATLANHGIGYEPHLVKTNEAKPLSPVILKHEEAWKDVIRGMHGVIVSDHPHGTGYRFGRPKNYSVAAKTGTAEVYRPGRYYSVLDADRPKKYRNHSLFIAFAPIKNPQIAIAVIAEHSPNAPTVARKVMDAYFKHPSEHFDKPS